MSTDLTLHQRRRAPTAPELQGIPWLSHLLASERERIVRYDNIEANLDNPPAPKVVIDGLPNKLIADELDISVRTVEVHRARVFDKMQVKSAVELANLLRGEGSLRVRQLGFVAITPQAASPRRRQAEGPWDEEGRVALPDAADAACDSGNPYSLKPLIWLRQVSAKSAV